jgi:hypothetical protein
MRQALEPILLDDHDKISTDASRGDLRPIPALHAAGNE